MERVCSSPCRGGFLHSLPLKIEDDRVMSTRRREDVVRISSSFYPHFIFYWWSQCLSCVEIQCMFNGSDGLHPLNRLAIPLVPQTEHGLTV